MSQHNVAKEVQVAIDCSVIIVQYFPERLFAGISRRGYFPQGAGRLVVVVYEPFLPGVDATGTVVSGEIPCVVFPRLEYALAVFAFPGIEVEAVIAAYFRRCDQQSRCQATILQSAVGFRDIIFVMAAHLEMTVAVEYFSVVDGVA